MLLGQQTNFDERKGAKHTYKFGHFALIDTETRNKACYNLELS
jgi:L-rhamnose isomerase